MEGRRIAVGALVLGLGVAAPFAVGALLREAPLQEAPLQEAPPGEASGKLPAEVRSVAPANDAGADGEARDGSASHEVSLADGQLSEVDDPLDDTVHGTLEAQREQLFTRMARYYGPEQMQAVRAVFDASTMMGQGNPEPTEHPMTRSECAERRAKHPGVRAPDPRCGAPFMAPVYAREPLATDRYADGGALPEAGLAPLPTDAASAKLCIDQYEFPGLPCEYPVVYVRANEAAALCEAVGKRLCDAHEWEGACAGSLRPIEVEYAFGDRRMLMQWFANRQVPKLWAYGAEKDHARCATHSQKNKRCVSGSWRHCGSNTYPAGAFPECVSAFGVYDQHGNAAEHMNLPLTPEQLMSRGGSGETEMKGSWFIFNSYEAHPDDCRYRAPAWHVTSVTAEDSHRNFHLGFRCCKSL